MCVRYCGRARSVALWSGVGVVCKGGEEGGREEVYLCVWVCEGGRVRSVVLWSVEEGAPISV